MFSDHTKILEKRVNDFWKVAEEKTMPWDAWAALAELEKALAQNKANDIKIYLADRCENSQTLSFRRYR